MGTEDLEGTGEGEIHGHINCLRTFFNKNSALQYCVCYHTFVDIVVCVFKSHNIYKMLEACTCGTFSTLIIQQAFYKVVLPSCRLMYVF